MRAFHSRVELVDRSGGHIRFLPGWLARDMVTSGSAEVTSANGKVRSIKLLTSVAHFAQRIGEPTPLTGTPATRFAVREWLDSGRRVWRFHRARRIPSRSDTG